MRVILIYCDISMMNGDDGEWFSYIQNVRTLYVCVFTVLYIKYACMYVLLHVTHRPTCHFTTSPGATEKGGSSDPVHIPLMNTALLAASLFFHNSNYFLLINVNKSPKLLLITYILHNFIDFKIKNGRLLLCFVSAIL